MTVCILKCAMTQQMNVNCTGFYTNIVLITSTCNNVAEHVTGFVKRDLIHTSHFAT